MQDTTGSRLLVSTGPVLMLVGALDPLELSVLIVAGALLGSLGVRLGGRPLRRPILWGLTLPAALGLALAVVAASQRQPVLLIPVGLLALGALMLIWGLRRGAPAEVGCIHMSALFIAVGVAAMWVLSSFGGFGEGALSWWWALLVLPYPVGWLRHLYSIGRWIGQGEEASPSR